MITKAEKHFDEDYHIVRHMCVQGKVTKDMVSNWLRVRAHKVVKQAEQEIEVSKVFGRQSKFELDLLKDMKDDKDDDDKEK